MLATSLRFRFNSSSTRPPTKDPKVKNDGSAAAAEGDKVGTKGDAGKEHKQSFRGEWLCRGHDAAPHCLPIARQQHC